MSHRSSPMDTKQKTEVELQDDQNDETEAQNEVTLDDLKSELAEELGLDPSLEEDAAILEKVAQREHKTRGKLNTAIKQKISWRDRAESKFDKADSESDGKSPNKGDSLDVDSLVDQKLQQKLDERDLKTLNLPDNIEQEVRDLAQLKGISVREASEHPYIANLKEQHAKELRIKNATPKRTKKGTYSVNIDPSKALNPSDFDFNTPEGVAQWKEAKRQRADFLKNN